MKRIPIGISDFKTLIQDNYLFVDKSELIKEFWDCNGQTVLLPRPRRFGKTLNMSMLKYFFTNGANKENIEENRALFKGLNIEKHEEIMKLCGKYPVIYLSFKDQKHSKFDNFKIGIKDVISSMYAQHIYCIQNEDILDIDNQYFYSVLNKKADLTSLGKSFEKLSQFIYSFYNKKVIILIDEYDVPIQAAFMHGYYDEAIEFMRNLLSGAFKDNIYLEKAMITGILRVAKESIFSGLNNIRVASILTRDFNNKFGFSEDEVEKLSLEYGLERELPSIKSWYNGYYFGGRVMYNPWSVLNYLSNSEDGFKAHWVNTSSNDLVNALLSRGNFQVKQELECLIKGDSIEKVVDENIVMGDIEKSSDYLWSFLLFTGYLKAERLEQKSEDEDIYYKLQIPNREVRALYRRIIERWYEDTITKDNYYIMLKALVSGDIESFEEIFKDYARNNLSYFDVSGDESEKVYHAFVLGMLISLSNDYEVLSNRESGYGRYDVCIIPRDTSKLGLIIEFKRVTSSSEKTMETVADEALKQIEDKKYVASLENRGVKNILKLAIVFKGKEVFIKSAI